MGGYLPQTQEDVEKLLAGAGLSSLEELRGAVPARLRLGRPLSLENGMAEQDVRKRFRSLAKQNVSMEDAPCFLGAGTYDRFIPAAVKSVASRSEFYTSYTPYQPEISQGTLMYIFEFQSMACALAGLDVANASLYDGPSALAEALLLCCRRQKRKKALLSEALSPQAKRTLKTYARFAGVELDWLKAEGGKTLPAKIPAAQYAAVVVQSPNYYGIVEDAALFSEASREAGALSVGYCENPHAMAVLKSFGEMGFDIAAGEMQGFGIEPFYGGPWLGYLCAKESLARSLPGRIVGATRDSRGNRAFALTLQAREQHIRREKATSNICTNQSLNCLKAVSYLALLGEAGVREAARQGMANARFLRAALADEGIKPLFGGPFVDEFPVLLPSGAAEAQKKMAQAGFIAGVALEENPNAMLLCATEKRTEGEALAFARALKEACQ
jgi:glycine dehydrogenase subunit 1